VNLFTGLRGPGKGQGRSGLTYALAAEETRGVCKAGYYRERGLGEDDDGYKKGGEERCSTEARRGEWNAEG